MARSLAFNDHQEGVIFNILKYEVPGSLKQKYERVKEAYRIESAVSDPNFFEHILSIIRHEGDYLNHVIMDRVNPVYDLRRTVIFAAEQLGINGFYCDLNGLIVGYCQ